MVSLSERLKLYLVLDVSVLKIPLEDFLKEVLEGGVTAIQYRDKLSSFSKRLDMACRIKEIIKPYNPLYIINDSFETALALGADGVHVGPEDLSPEYIKKKAPHFITGLSCNNLDDCRRANMYADYAGVGPYTYTSTKKNIRDILGEDGLKRNVSHLKVPSVAIGGICYDNVSKVMGCGVSGVAVSSYLCSSQEPYKDTVKLLGRINEGI